MSKDQIQEIISAMGEMMDNKLEINNGRIISLVEIEIEKIRSIFNDQYADDQADFKELKDGQKEIRSELKELKDGQKMSRNDLNVVKEDVKFMKNLLKESITPRLEKVEELVLQ